MLRVMFVCARVLVSPLHAKAGVKAAWQPEPYHASPNWVIRGLIAISSSRRLIDKKEERDENICEFLAFYLRVIYVRAVWKHDY